MKPIKFFMALNFFLVSICAVSLGQVEIPDPYRTGKIRLEPELVLDDASMPDELFFESLSTVSCDTEGNVYVIDSGALNIKKFDAQGNFLKTIGRAGQGPGEFGHIYYSTFARDRLVVWDSGNRRLYAFTPEGELLRSGSIDYDEGSVRKLASLPTGDIVVEKEKTFRNQPDKPQLCTIDIYSPDLEYVRTIYKKNLWRKKYIRTREYGTTVLFFPYSPDVWWETSPEGYIIIGYSDKYELEVYNREGEKIISFSHACKPAKVTDKDKRDFFDGIEFYRMGERLKEPPEYIMKYTEFPPFKPAYRNILVDSDGNILVVLNQEQKEERGREFDVFGPEGKFLVNVRIEGPDIIPDSRNIHLDNGSLYVLETGEDDLYRVIRYRIVRD